MLQNAVLILRNNRGPILAYGTGLMLFGYAMWGLQVYLDTAAVVDPESDLKAVLDVSRAVVHAAVIAALMATCFSRVAKSVESSLWRVSGHIEAVRRFFGIWFLLVLIRTVVDTLMLLAAGPNPSEEISIPIALISFFLTSWIVPFGTFIIFHDRGERLNYEVFREGLTALGTHIATVLVVVLINFMILLAFGLLFIGLPKWAAPLTEYVTALRVMFIFSWSWIICIFHRDHYEPDNDADFDL